MACHSKWHFLLSTAHWGKFTVFHDLSRLKGHISIFLTHIFVPAGMFPQPGNMKRVQRDKGPRVPKTVRTVQGKTLHTRGRGEAGAKRRKTTFIAAEKESGGGGGWGVKRGTRGPPANTALQLPLGVLTPETARRSLGLTKQLSKVITSLTHSISNHLKDPTHA